jgi:uncharacterized cupredoxin-like copper-binding protein
MTLKPGPYVFQLQNTGKFPHDLHIAPQGGDEMAKSTVMTPAQATTLAVTLKKGTYTIWCAIDGHRQRGMEGTITVK